MEILFVLILGGGIGAIARYSLPRREQYGSVVAPALGAASATTAWVVLTWSGLKWDAGLIWWLSLLVPLAVSIVVVWRLGVQRSKRDESRFSELSRNGSIA